MKDVVIVESPAKARTITKILGREFIILASMGHVRDLPKKQLGIDIIHDFTPTYQVSDERKKTIATIQKAVAHAKCTFLATDPDREGEAIAWHLYELLRKNNPKTSFKRVTFHEITKQAVQESFKHPGSINMDLVNSQQARRILDRLVGYQVSPLLWRNVGRQARSAGRVQSVALRLICEREQSIRAFVPKEYWTFQGQFSSEEHSVEFTAKLQEIDGKKAEVGKKALSESITSDMLQGTYHVASISHTPKKRRPYPPFITSTLQQAASTNLHFSTKKTMMIAQQLYEGIETGSGPVGLITYMRTDSTNISKEAQGQAKEYILQEFGESYVPPKPNFFKSNKSAQEAHEAIRPTDIFLLPQKTTDFLDQEQKRLYQLIWKRFIASQMAHAQYKTHALDLLSKNTQKIYGFRTSVTEVVFPGYLKLYHLDDVVEKKSPASANNTATDSVDYFPPLKVNDTCAIKDVENKQKFTEPPPRFSEGTLVRDLEKNGVGRPSTYATILSTIQQRNYVEKTKGVFTPTPVGETVCDYLVSNLAKLFEIQFTAKMEEDLDGIEQGKISWTTMLGTFYNDFSLWLGAIESSSFSVAFDTIKRILALFPEEFDWDPPRKVGKRVYNDKKFINSLQDQVEKGKNFTEKQWQALLIVGLRYKESLPEFSQIVTELGLEDVCNELSSRVEKAKQAAIPYSPDALEPMLCQCLNTVKKWDDPVKHGKRVFDDQKFYQSLSGQLQEGKRLSVSQRDSLKRLYFKYQDHMDADQKTKLSAIHGPLESLASQQNGPKNEKIQRLLDMAKHITTWDEKTKTSGFDEQSFVQSVTTQFQSRGSLSKKQQYALQKIMQKYKDQLPDDKEEAKEGK